MARSEGNWREIAAKNDRAHAITPFAFWQALVDQGILDREWDGLITRVVIDANIEDGGYVKMYVERMGDQRLLRVSMGLQGIHVRLGTPSSKDPEDKNA